MRKINEKLKEKDMNLDKEVQKDMNLDKEVQKDMNLDKEVQKDIYKENNIALESLININKFNQISIVKMGGE